uniref:Uncharacterized protein n=1 Tax=Tetradesmus obliquus TaxID=3088 RepID=A0A383WIR3_TETOB|eukprot:jgi/Sobl393_1/5003/SZX76636.1
MGDSESSSSSSSGDTARFIAEILSLADTAADAVMTSDALRNLAQYTVRHAGQVQLQQLLPADTPVSTALLQRLLVAVTADESSVAVAWGTLLVSKARPEQLMQLPAALLVGVATCISYPVAALEEFGWRSNQFRVASGPLLLHVAAAALQDLESLMAVEDGMGGLATSLLFATRASSDSYGSPSGSSSSSSSSSSNSSSTPLSAAAVPAVVGPGAEGSEVPLLPLPQLLSWLKQQCQQENPSCIASMSALLETMLLEGADWLSQQESWQLYELLLELQQQPAWQQQQQQATGLSTAACDALIQQQQAPGESAESAARVLQLLQHSACGSSQASQAADFDASKVVACYEQLSSDSQQAVLAAAVRLGCHEAVLQLVLQTAAAGDALQRLLSLWQQQLTAVDGSSEASTEGFAGAAVEGGLGRVCGDAPPASVLLAALTASLRGPDAASQAAWEAAQALVSECLASGIDAGVPAAFTADTVASYAAAAAAAAAAASSQTARQQQLHRMAGIWQAHRSDLQPAAAAVLLGAVSQPQLSVATVTSNGNQQQQQQQPAASACSHGTKLIAQVCNSLAYPAAAADSAAATSWVDELSSPAAAAALFTCWYWQQPGDPGLLLLLYHRSRQAPGSIKPSLGGLLLDLGLAAAGRAGDWHAGAAIVSSARTIQAGGKGSSSRSSRGSADVAPEWVPLLPEARAVLLAALVHEQQGSPLQGISHAVQLLSQAAGQARTAWVEQQQQPSQQQGKTGKQSKQQQGKASGSKQAAKSTGSSSISEPAGADYTQLLTLPVLQALLAACVDAVTDEQGKVADEAAAAAAGNAVADLMSLLLGRSLLQLVDQRQRQQQQGAAPSSLPALVLPDAQAWSLLVQLLGAAGRYSWVAGLVSAAARGTLPLAECDTAAAAAAAVAGPRRWSAGDLQCMLSAAAGVWLSAGCPGLVLAMLDALAAAGGSSLDNAQLAWAVTEATGGEGDVLYDGLAARLADEEDIFEALPQLAGQHTQQQEAAAAAGNAAWMQLIQGWQAPCGGSLEGKAGAAAALQQPEASAGGIRLGKKNTRDRQPAAAAASSSQDCCAERNLLAAWVTRASRAGVPRHQVVHWVRRKAGGSITVWRHLADGSLGVSVPCVVCKAALARFDLRVTCMVAPGQWYCGRLTEPGAPRVKPTSGQLMRMCKASSS